MARPMTSPSRSPMPSAFIATPRLTPTPMPMAVHTPSMVCWRVGCSSLIGRRHRLLVVGGLLGGDAARRLFGHAGLPAAPATPIGKEDPQQEDGGHAHEEEQEQVDEHEGGQQPERPFEGEHAYRDEQQDGGEQ